MPLAPPADAERAGGFGLSVRRARSTLLLVALLLATPAVPAPRAGGSGALTAQEVELQQEENFRMEPNGTVLAVLGGGSSWRLLQERDSWVEAVVEGWVWSQSLQLTDRNEFDLVVTAGQGENLRDRPQGEILGRLSEGTLLEEMERIPGWIRIRRRGWIWRASVELREGAAPSETGAPVRGAGSGSPAAPDEGASGGGGDSAVLRVRTPLTLLSAPNGDTLTRVRPGADLVVTRREGGWIRVQLEGWVREPPAGEGIGVGAPPDEAPLAPDAVAADPVGSRGRIVEWELQFVSLERAEAVRTDFHEGEPFLLMRPGGDGPARFVYVAIPEERVAEVRSFAPLERLGIRGRVRTGASALTGSPILDLIEITRRR